VPFDSRLLLASLMFYNVASSAMMFYNEAMKG